MDIPKEIKSMPWAKLGRVSGTQRYRVTACKKIIAGTALYVIDFIANPNYNSSWVLAKTLRVVVSNRQKDFAVREADKTRYARRRVDWFDRYTYAEVDEKSEKVLCTLCGVRNDGNHGLEALKTRLDSYYSAQIEQARAARGLIADDDVGDCPRDMPDGLVDFVRREIIEHDHTLVYKKGNIRGTCAYCGVKVHARHERFKQYSFVTCPNCGERVQCILENSAANSACEVGAVSALQKGKDGDLWIRTWLVRRNNNAEYPRLKDNLIESARYLIRGRKAAMWTGYERSMERSKNIYNYYYGGKFFDGNLAEVVQGTPLQYAQLADYAANNNDTLMYCINFCRFPIMEFLWKRGYKRMVHEKNSGYNGGHGNCIYWQRERVKDCFKIPMALFNRFEPADMTMKKLDDITAFSNAGLNWDDITLIVDCGGNLKDVELISKYVRMRRAIKYISLQGTARSRLFGDYADYLTECVKLNYDMKSKSVLFPRDLQTAHAHTSALIREERDKIVIDGVKKAAEKAARLNFGKGNLMIRPAESPHELAMEGATLHHCVGGYAKRVANGETLIMFVRQKSEPDKPYYTLELMGKEVIQCRTLNNDSYEKNQAVKSFVNAWLSEKVKNKKRSS